MCGIGAIFKPGSSPADSAADELLHALRHRGPDGEGTYRSGPALLVHTRLAIIDVAGGRQPLLSEDGRCASVVNGEIYNYRELRDELEDRGHRFTTRSDSEVVVHAYEEYGLDCVHRLNGIFAFILWDDARQRLVLARDPFGVKPLYWRTYGRAVAAASEVGALLRVAPHSPAVDPIALDHYLAWRFVPAPRTLFLGIQKLPAATLLIADADGIDTQTYRRPPQPPLLGATPDELAHELERRLVDAVGRQMMSEVPYGAFLSGGLDSAAIAAAMRHARGSAPTTFTIGFPGHGGDLDERDAAAATARAVGTDHHATELREPDFLAQVARSVRALEEPCGTASAPAALELSRFAARSVKVVLSGQGADEALGGYPRHQAGAALAMVDRYPAGLEQPFVAAAEALPRNERAKRAARLLGAPPGLPRLLRIFEITDAETRAALSGGPTVDSAEERLRLAGQVVEDVDERGAGEQALYLDTHLFLPDSLLLYGDKTSMAWGLEQRVPFLDHELMQFVERIPGELRVRRLRRKWLYRKAVRRLVPREVLGRRKHPFATPYDEWLRSSLGHEVRTRYANDAALSQLIDPSVVARLAAEHRSGRRDNKRILYCLLELSEWHRAFIEPTSRAVGSPLESV